MIPDRLAVWLDSYRSDTKTALKQAARQGFRVVQANTLAGELNPATLTDSGRRHLLRYLRDLGLTLDVAAASFPGAGLADPACADQRMEHVRRTIELCRAIGINQTVVTLPGVGSAESGVAAGVVLELADLADRTGVNIALSDDQSEFSDLAQRLGEIGCRELGIALDTGATAGKDLRLTESADLVAGLYLRDTRRRGAALEEVEHGQGEVDFRGLLAALAAVERPIHAAIRRDDPRVEVDALRAGREYMEMLLKPLGRG